ncbi:MAG: ABC transporter permease [Solirubrobacteraceae bacterium]
MTILVKSLRDRRRSVIGWGVGIAALTALLFLYWPSIKGNPELDRFIQRLPEAVRAITGRGGYSTPAGYLNTELFSFMMPLLLLVVAIGMGARAIAGEEERGTLELLLSTPVSRRRVLLEKVAAGLLIMLALGAVLLAALLIGARASSMDISAGRLAAAAASAVALSLPFGALALALGCATGVRGAAIGPTVAVAVATYLLNTLGPLTSALRPYKSLSPFDWYGSEAALSSGPRWGYLALLAGTAAVLCALAAVLFDRRDIA